MDLTTAVSSLGTDYVNKITDAFKDSATVNTNNNNGDGTFDSIYNSVAGLLASTNS